MERIQKEIKAARANESIKNIYTESVKSNMNLIELMNDDFNSSNIQVFGAAITSLILNSKELLFISEKSSKSLNNFNSIIRGGISLSFPNFETFNEVSSQCEFTRAKKWIVVEPYKYASDLSCSSFLKLSDDEETRSYWNYKFELNYNVKISSLNAIKFELIVNNKDDTEFEIKPVFNVYFKLDDINNAKLYGLKNANYIDKVQNSIDIKETNEYFQVNGETDRIYYDTSKEQILDTGNDGYFRIRIIKQNCPDVFVWNPWIEKTKEISDLNDEEYKRMICIGVGHGKNKVTLKPNDSYKMSLMLVSETNF